MSGFWKKIERVGFQSFPYWLDDTDICYYAREYHSGGGYAASEANNLITNYKKPVDRRGRAEWRYKEDAIRQFARELAIIDFSGLVVTCIPSSKCSTDPMFDDRMEQTLLNLQAVKPGAIIEYPFRLQTTIPAAHLGGPRDIDSFYRHLAWNGFTTNPVNNVLLVDDVITTGGKFKACKRLILEHHPGATVYGIFWARTVWDL
jgi:hypothetical protein